MIIVKMLFRVPPKASEDFGDTISASAINGACLMSKLLPLKSRHTSWRVRQGAPVIWITSQEVLIPADCARADGANLRADKTKELAAANHLRGL